MTVITAAHHDLDARLAGEVVTPADAGWDAARGAFNLTIDQRPEAVAFAHDARDVAAVVDHARRHGLSVAAQGTGHNAGPLGALDGTILLRTSRLGGVRIDRESRRVRVGAGVKWEKVTPALSELGLAALHGSSPDVGVVGYSLGGGMGWLARKHGLQANAVTAIELVTADGELVRADATSEPELFWALRGGGGSFGVVTAVEFEAVPVAELYAGALFFPAARASEVLHAWHGLLPGFPEELMTWASVMHFPPLPEVPEPVRGQSFAVVLGAFLGEEADGRDLLAPLRALGPAMDTFAVQPPAGLAELAMDPPEPVPYVSGHQLLEPLSPGALDELVALARPPLVAVQLRHMGGALARAPQGAGARATLPGELSMFAVGVAPDEASGAAARASLDALRAALRAHEAGSYPNFVEEPVDVGALYDPPTWARLRAVKAQYDPTDLFRGNHHVTPSDGP